MATLKVQGLAALVGGEGRVNRLRGIKAGEAGEGGGGSKMILGGGLVQRHGHDLLLLVRVTRHPLQRMVPREMLVSEPEPRYRVRGSGSETK